MATEIDIPDEIRTELESINGTDPDQVTAKKFDSGNVQLEFPHGVFNSLKMYRLHNWKVKTIHVSSTGKTQIKVGRKDQ